MDYVIPVPKENCGLPPHGTEGWQSLARSRRFGFQECVGDDLKIKMVAVSAHRQAQAGETMLFSWIVFKSRADRDHVNARVMKDSRSDDAKAMPFDSKRMVYGGFKVIVDA